MNDYLCQLFGLKNKTAVIIGAGGYLCGEMARGLAQSGVNVVLLDKNKKNLKKTLDSVKPNNPRAFMVVCDATKKEDHKKALKIIMKQCKRVDILINGAGINAPTPFLDITLKEWHAILDAHITATMFGCQVFGAQMVKQRSGSIINLSSASANPPLSKAFTYSVAKAGIKNLTQNLGREWARCGVRVNALRPGFFPTEWSKKHFITAERKRAILNHTPMGRFGTPQELLGAVLWLSSDAAGFVTGAEIAVDGGFSCMTI